VTQDSTDGSQRVPPEGFPCRFCGKPFTTPQARGGHESRCAKNPGRKTWSTKPKGPRPGHGRKQRRRGDLKADLEAIFGRIESDINETAEALGIFRSGVERLAERNQTLRREMIESRHALAKLRKAVSG